MSLFFRPRKRDVPVRRYTTALIEELLASVRRQSLSLLEFNRALWGAIPTSTILLEYRGDHRVPFSIHDQVFMNEVAVQRLSRPIFKVRGVPSSINSTTLVDGFLAAITPLSTELADTRELLVPKVASPTRSACFRLPYGDTCRTCSVVGRCCSPMLALRIRCIRTQVPTFCSINCRQSPRPILMLSVASMKCCLPGTTKTFVATGS